MNRIEGQAACDGDTHVLIVASRFNQEVVEHLINGAQSALLAAGCRKEHMTLVQVPGAWEIPFALQQALATGRYDGAVALGAVIRGETTHYDYVCSESARGVADVSLRLNMPIGFGVLTTEDKAQALARAREGNKGKDAADACLEMLSLSKQVSSKDSLTALSHAEETMG